MASSDELQTLRRGLQALAILIAEGPSNVARLARRLEVPRANANRIVNTLASEGYCRKIPNSHLYVATIKSQTSITNPCFSSLITEASIDIIEDLGRLIKWPLALATPQGATMVTRLATHLSTPLALSRIAPGNVSPVLDAATGITYLAFSDFAVREEVLAEAAITDPNGYRDWAPHLPVTLEQAREDGYFIMRRTGAEATLAVPIMLSGEPVGGIAMRYIKSAASRASVIELYLPRLREAAEAIEASISDGYRPAAPQPTVHFLDASPLPGWSRGNAA